GREPHRQFVAHAQPRQGCIRRRRADTRDAAVLLGIAAQPRARAEAEQSTCPEVSGLGAWPAWVRGIHAKLQLDGQRLILSDHERLCTAGVPLLVSLEAVLSDRERALPRALAEANSVERELSGPGVHGKLGPRAQGA